MAIFLTRSLRNDSLKQICDQFEMTKYSSASSIVERMKALVKKECKLWKRVEKLISVLMIQEQTLFCEGKKIGGVFGKRR